MIPVRAVVVEMVAVTMDGSTIELRCKVNEGPENLLDRRITVQLNRATLDKIIAIRKG
jgi:hypothetical protein